MKDYEQNRRRLALLEPALVTPERIRSTRGLQHLKEGFNRRLLMLDASLRFVFRKAGQLGGRPVSSYTATDLAIHLNAFYLNLCGALDNLAWALQYEHQLLPGVDEGSPGRKQINLFGRQFLEALTKLTPGLASALRVREPWNADLKALRDPAAHRIPIYAVPGVLDQAHGEEFQRLQKEATRLFATGDHNGGMDLIFQSQTLGTYQPWMALSYESGFELRDVVKQVGQDDENLVTVSVAVLQYLFAGWLPPADLPDMR
jgi:hypothetical protein